MLKKSMLAVLFVCCGRLAYADAQAVPVAARGELLYSTHCIACHNTEVHWRERKLVNDWSSLRSQVRRWQAVSGLGWSDQDIAEVAQYLNAIYYHYPASD